jgi:hypothetical protein
MKTNGNDFDRRFFEANPDRSYHLRVAAKDEIDWYLEHEPAPPPVDFFLYAVTRQFCPGKRVSCLAALRGDGISDNEETARWVWDTVCEPGFFLKDDVVRYVKG